MKIITLDNYEFKFSESLLPCLIHGIEKSGASYFSVSLVENLVLQNSKVIFFTAFPMAKEQLISNVGVDKLFDINTEYDITKIPDNKSIIIQSGNLDLGKKVIQEINNLQEYIIFIKNIEEYDNSIFELIKDNPKIILSGNLDSCCYNESLENQNWASRIFFSKPINNPNIIIPNLEKFDSYFISKDVGGVLR